VVLVATGVVEVDDVEVVAEVEVVVLVVDAEVQATNDASTTITSRRPRNKVILDLFT